MYIPLTRERLETAACEDVFQPSLNTLIHMSARRHNRCCLRLKSQRLLDDDQEGPRTFEERSCTDVLCLLLFGAAMALLALVGSVSVRLGDITRIQFGKDHLGRRCGVGELSNLSMIFYHDLGGDLWRQRELVSRPWLLKLDGICAERCPQRGEVISDVGVASAGAMRGVKVYESTVPILNRCVPTDEVHQTEQAYCVAPRCAEINAQYQESQVECTSPPGHEGDDDYNGSWIMRSTQDSERCRRELTLTTNERFSVPNRRADPNLAGVQ